MNKKAAAVCAGLVSLSLGSAEALAEPKVYGQLGARVIDRDNSDVSVQAYDVRLGVKGQGKYNDIVAIYQFEAEFTSSTNNHSSTPDDGDELEIRRARILFPTKAGILVVAPKTPSGHQKDLYGPVDIFETNEAHADNGVSSIFAQRETSSHVLAYVTPKFGGARAVVAYQTAQEDNGQDMDYLSWRATWQGDWNESTKGTAIEGLKLGMGQVYLDEAAIFPGAGDWQYDTYMISYDTGGFHVAATFEDYDRGVLADHRNYGVVASYTWDGWTAAIGQFDHDVKGTATGDNDGTVLSLKKQVHEDLMFFVESGSFEQNGQDSLSAGIKLLF